MNTITLDSLAQVVGGTARFEGGMHDSPVSFFVVRNQPGDGADKHRHPYAETFIVLDGDIEAIIDGELRMLGPGTITVIPTMAWHEFKNRSDHRSLMVNVHPGPEIVQEDWVG
jgi:quercetin dioxygenase-like cupin family protein